MPLLSFWKNDPQAVLSMSIEQIVASAGDGRLLDDSECSRELRAFLREVQTENLRRFAEHCLVNSFPKSGQVLQDVVNELGRRLEFEVIGGRYTGRANVVGNDGLWRSPERHDLVVEVKTTDTYRIPLDTIAGYRDVLRERREIGPDNSMLVVVGREDTGELEAQVRGSRHAWDMRLISVDALLRLLEIKEGTEEESTAQKIRGLLKPAEYTRLDSLVDVLFTAARDVEGPEIVPEAKDDKPAESSWEFTPRHLLAEKRKGIITTVSDNLGVQMIRKTRATYWSAERTERAVCTISKRYSGTGSVAYWYAFHPAWDRFLGEGEKGFLLLGMMDLEFFYMIPHAAIKTRLLLLNTTQNADGSVYWHLKVLETKGDSFLQMPRTGEHLPLKEFRVPLE